MPKLDVELVEFPLHLKYLEAEFFLWGSLGYGLDKFAPELADSGWPPIGAQIAKLSPLIRDVITQFGFQEVGHLRAIKDTLTGFARLILNISRESFATVMDDAFRHPLKPPFDAYANDINYLLASYVIPYVGLTGYVGVNPKLQSSTAKRDGYCSTLLESFKTENCVLLQLLTDSETEIESEPETEGRSHLTDMPQPTTSGVQPVPQLEGFHYCATGKDNSIGPSSSRSSNENGGALI
ncbi:Desiccation-related protein PCC13-62 [Capsicum annuum]|uniref:Desiccation-related protein PCC13-62 n=1 Tax=Capsicum annuum TaxID=4072 RepID=A0A2G2YJH3_CAPAN|nr:Desiccation-related protein PCC13-62 [Capsicum annuum]